MGNSGMRKTTIVAKASAEHKPTDILAEIGSTGLRRSGLRGLVDEEFLPELKGERARKAFRQMSSNDPVVGAVLFAINMLIRNVSWRVEGEDEEAVEFTESCLTDMSSSWEDLIAEILSMLVYGFSWHEVVYKKRSGENRDPKKNSQYSDGRFGWRKIPIRSQDSLMEWIWDEEGGIQAMVQSAPPDYALREVPIERSLLFRTGIHKGNPEGYSILRNAYRPWYFKTRLEEIEAIGHERDLAGLPVIYGTPEILKAHEAALKTILTSVRRDEQDGILFPLVLDELGNKQLVFELLGSPGSRQLDISGSIERYDKRIATSVLAQFILLGQQQVGSFALASSQTALFASALGAILKSVAAVFNQHGIPRLFRVNAWKVKEYPKLVPGDIETPDLKEVGAFVTAMAGAGVPLFPDDELENHLREIANWPAKPEGAEQSSPLPPKPKAEPEKPEPEKTKVGAKE